MRVGGRTMRATIAATMVAASIACVACAPVDPDAPDAVKRVMAEECWGCHSSTKAMGWKASSRSAAEAMIDRMIGHGAELSPAEKEILISYFLR